MSFAKIVNGAVAAYPYTVASLAEDNPYTNYPLDVDLLSMYPQTEAGLAGCVLVQVQSITPPTIDPATQLCTEGTPALVNGTWTQTWVVTQMTTDQLAAYQASLVPQQVTAAQAKIALQNAGLYQTVVTYMQTADVVDQIAWSSAPYFTPNSPMLTNLAQGLNLTPEQVQGLFVAAAAVII